MIGRAILIAAVLYVAWRAMRPAQESAPDDVLDFVDHSIMSVATITGTWYPPDAYAGWIAETEQANGIPENLLARLLYQESRYRDDIISGATRSPAGALGIAQFMPATAAEWGIDPLDPYSAIEGAGRYIAWLYGQFGDWSLALAAYNWGIGNVKRKGLQNAPRETVAYVTDILGDIAA